MLINHYSATEKYHQRRRVKICFPCYNSPTFVKHIPFRAFFHFIAFLCRSTEATSLQIFLNAVHKYFWICPMAKTPRQKLPDKNSYFWFLFRWQFCFRQTYCFLYFYFCFLFSLTLWSYSTVEDEIVELLFQLCFLFFSRHFS